MPPGATRLAALMVTRQQFASSVDALMTRYLGILDDPDATSLGRAGYGLALAVVVGGALARRLRTRPDPVAVEHPPGGAVVAGRA